MLSEINRSIGKNLVEAGLTDEAPPMRVCLFGGLRVYIDGVEVLNYLWVKAKCKLLLAHLVTRFGREVARDILLTSLWPNMNQKKAVDNFYVTWSMLRKTLQSAGGGDRSFVRSIDTLYSVDPDLVESDVHELDMLAREMLFGNRSHEDMGKMIVRIDKIYTGDILTGVDCDAYMLKLRDRYRATYVDVLLAGAKSMMDSGNSLGALWFARKAFGVDANREDVYQTLMSIQALSGQRTAAMETFFQCKEYLDSELGIPLSKRTVDLYQRLINDDM